MGRAEVRSGSVFTWGRAKNFRLGHPFSGRDVRVPEEVTSLRGCGIKSAACGGGHTAVILENNTLHVFGYSQYGQLGLGDRTDMCEPSQVLLIPDGMEHKGVAASQPVAEVCCGRYHTIARSKEGQLWSWGGGKNGRLGHADEKIRPQPSQILVLKAQTCVKVTAGYHCNLALTDDGVLYSWGWGAHGQLGQGDTNDRGTPTPIESLSEVKIKALACGDRHAFAVADSGHVYAWGSNQFGQLGFGRKGDTLLSPTLIPGLDGLIIESISCGDRHSAAITNVGSLYTWGCGSDGQCGHGNLHDVLRPRLVETLVGHRVVNVCCGHNFTLALTNTKMIFAFGNNTYGQLGNNGDGKQETPVRVILNSDAPVRSLACAHFHCILWTKTQKLNDNLPRQESSSTCDAAVSTTTSHTHDIDQQGKPDSQQPTEPQAASVTTVQKEELAEALAALTAKADLLLTKKETEMDDKPSYMSTFELAVQNLKALDVSTPTS
eukprot:Plantae.Rhodophyta-Hildenbrandia_rubra.ctg28712.p1 GENE.Plantae.Rhodophyta-Hildenbrandia_rubra.ctg28712~~Plantae.Rhodophyta-Hildenbrandia_rubra.ctg28712.p1  ORF type:complete len:491 (+),score=46.49 Plantae.Rhodophyta-Hildenbrandia_rubra.ctg28712:2016-3488(+)